MDRVYMDMAYEQAEKSVCLRAKVGAVIVKDGMVVAQGYNNMTGGISDCAEVGCIREKLNIPSGTRREVCRAICAEQTSLLVPLGDLWIEYIWIWLMSKQKNQFV